MVPLDGSAEALAVIGPALRIARTLQVPLELMTVHDPVRGEWAADIDEVAAGIAYEHVEVSVVGTGWAGDVIVGLVADQPGTVVCMATHNRDRLTRMVVGSVTEHVLHHAAAPLLMVGPGHLPEPEDSGYDRALVCLDGGPRDEFAIAVAECWARQLKLELELVHVTESSGVDGATARLSRIAERLQESGRAAAATVLTGTHPAQRLTELMAERPKTLAVLASHGRVGLSRIVLGSVSSKVLQASPLPLLLTRAP
nr:universal stress protein [Nocardiopsis mwathae]